jgi:hypothetical protein
MKGTETRTAVKRKIKFKSVATVIRYANPECPEAEPTRRTKTRTAAEDPQTQQAVKSKMDTKTKSNTTKETPR